MQRSVKTVLHTTSVTKLDYDMRKERLDMNMMCMAQRVYMDVVHMHCVSAHD